MRFAYLLLCFFLIPTISPTAYADSESTWDDISNVGVASLIGTALILPYTREDWNGLHQSTYSILTATAVSLICKTLMDEERPDNSDNESFPSGHTATATTLYRRYGWQTGIPAYAVATHLPV